MLTFKRINPSLPKTKLKLYGDVRLLGNFRSSGRLFRKGAEGVLVDLFVDGTCIVEFSSPVEDAFTLRQSDIEPA